MPIKTVGLPVGFFRTVNQTDPWAGVGGFHRPRPCSGVGHGPAGEEDRRVLKGDACWTLSLRRWEWYGDDGDVETVDSKNGDVDCVTFRSTLVQPPTSSANPATTAEAVSAQPKRRDVSRDKTAARQSTEGPEQCAGMIDGRRCVMRILFRSVKRHATRLLSSTGLG